MTNSGNDSPHRGCEQIELIFRSATRFPHSIPSLQMSKKLIAITILTVLGIVIAMSYISEGVTIPSRTGAAWFITPVQVSNIAISHAGTGLNAVPGRSANAVVQSALGKALRRFQQLTRQSADVGINLAGIRRGIPVSPGHNPAHYLWPDTVEGYGFTPFTTTKPKVTTAQALITTTLTNNVPIGFTTDVLKVTTAQRLTSPMLIYGVPLGFMTSAANVIPDQTQTNNVLLGFTTNVLKVVNDRSLIAAMVAISVKTISHDVPLGLKRGFNHRDYWLWLGFDVVVLLLGLSAAFGDFKRSASFWSAFSCNAASRGLVPSSSAGTPAVTLARSAYAIVNAKRIAESAGYPCRFAVQAGGLLTQTLP